MNSVHVSGLVKGQATEVKGGAFTRVITTQDNKGKSNEFTIHAGAGDYATKLAEIPSGKRLIFEGRLSNEELEEKSGIYQGVISVVRFIAVVDANAGQDYARACVSGLASGDEVRTTSSGSSVANLNIKNTRNFYSKKQNQDISLTTYVNAVAWTDKAKSLESVFPITEVFTEVTGMLVPSEYPSTKHDGAMVKKIEIWIDEVTIPGKTLETSAPEPRKAAAPRPPKARKGTDDELGF